jgi:hypothetical protein
LELLSSFCYVIVKSKEVTYVALLDPSKRPDWQHNVPEITTFLRISCIAEEVVSFEAFWNLSSLFFCVQYRCLYLRLCNNVFFLQYSKMLEWLILKINVKLEVLFRSVGLNLYLKCRRSLVFLKFNELLPDYTVSS